MGKVETTYNRHSFLKASAISGDNVIHIMSPNPERGQNVKTSMPMILAEGEGENLVYGF